MRVCFPLSQKAIPLTKSPVSGSVESKEELRTKHNFFVDLNQSKAQVLFGFRNVGPHGMSNVWGWYM
jgi:hypothetical protein